MFDFLKKRKANDTNTSAPVVNSTLGEKPVIPQPKYDFVEQYTCVPPQNLMFGYDYWSLCKNVPVWCENSSSAFNKGVNIPTAVFFPWWKTVLQAPLETVNNKKSRTISIVKLKNGGKLYILPNLKNQENPIYAYKEGELGMQTTPEINRAIVEQIKMFTR